VTPTATKRATCIEIAGLYASSRWGAAGQLPVDLLFEGVRRQEIASSDTPPASEYSFDVALAFISPPHPRSRCGLVPNSMILDDNN
jgi:hypothetical protein